MVGGGHILGGGKSKCKGPGVRRVGRAGKGAPWLEGSERGRVGGRRRQREVGGKLLPGPVGSGKDFTLTLGEPGATGGL